MRTKEKLKTLFTSYWSYFAIATACKLGVFDFLSNNESNINKLAKGLNLDKFALQKLLDFLEKNEMLRLVNGQYTNTEESDLLTENHPESLKYACLNWYAEHLMAWQKLPDTIITGKSFFDLNYNTDFFSHLSSDKEKLQAYHKAMREYARDDYKHICSIVDFGIHKSVMDVGGGTSVLTHIIKNNNQNLECINFDLPEVIKLFPNNITTNVAGDFFEHIPALSDAIILSRIIHDWEDEKAKIIISNCYKALPKNGTLYVIENCKDLVENDLSLLSLNMMLICNSVERASHEYIKLAEQCNFLYEEMRKLNDLQTIMIFKK